MVLRDRYNTQDIEIALTRLDTDIALSQAESGHATEELVELRRLIEAELADYFRSFCASDALLAQSGWLMREAGRKR